MNNVGTDYGLGQTNVDSVTGLRFGVISQHSIMLEWIDSGYDRAYNEAYEQALEEARKETELTEEEFDEDSFDSCLEDCGCHYVDDEYEIVDCLDSDLMILKSPYFTFAQYCSPCVPGAGNLDVPLSNGVKTLCLGHDWFEGGKAPYPVHSIKTGLEVVNE